MKNNACANSIRALLIIYAVFVNRVPNQVLSLYDSFLFRLALAAFIVYMVFIDPITALLLAAVFVLSVQERNYRRASGNGLLAIGSSFQQWFSNLFQRNNNGANGLNGANGTNGLNGANGLNGLNGANGLNGQNNNLARAELPVSEPSNVPYEQEHPSSQTLSNNLTESGQGSDFTSVGQLKAAQNNLISGVDPDEGVKTFTNQLGPQGLNMPTGYDLEGSTSSKF